MTEQGLRAMEAARQLRAALTLTAGALSHADLDGLLHSESQVELALRNQANFSGLPADERASIRLELDAAGRELRRCRRMGTVLFDVIRLTLEAQGRSSGYGPRDLPAVSYRSTLNAKV